MTYQSFTNTNTSVLLLDNQDAGGNNLHSIDLKLNFLSTPKADIFRATLKFEIE